MRYPGPPRQSQSWPRNRPPPSRRPCAANVHLPNPAPATAVRDVLPLWMQMPAEWRDAVPDLSNRPHRLFQEPSERLVYIKGHRYTEGELVEGKLTIEKITREGVILSYRAGAVCYPADGVERSLTFAPCRSAAPSTSTPRPRPTTAAGSSSCGAIRVGSRSGGRTASCRSWLRRCR